MITMEIMMMIWWWSQPQTHPNDDDNDDNVEDWLWTLNMIMMTDDWNDNDNNVDHNDDNDDNVTASAMVTMINKMVIIPPAKPRQPVYTENLESQPPQLPKTKSRFDLRDQKNLFRPPSDHIDTL